MALKDSSSGDDDFPLPPMDWPNNNVGAALGKLLVTCTSAIAQGSFSAGSWPQEVNRLLLYCACSRDAAASKQMERICQSQQNGPLCFWTAHLLLQYLNPPLAGTLPAPGKNDCRATTSAGNTRCS